MLEIQELATAYGKIQALKGVSLQAQAGEVTCLLGPNGAGKTTLMRVITGIVKPQEGSVHLDGRNLDGLAINQRIRAGMALAQQIVQPLRQMTLLENVALACGGAKTASPFLAMKSFDRAAERDRAMKLLARVGLEKAAESEPSKLPLGYLKRLEVARALALDPKLLLLDEPLAGLNQSEASALADLIKTLNEDGLTILLIEHNLREVMRICPEVYVQEQGRSLAFGDAKEVMGRPDVIKAYLGGS
jgi:branched-chain amino acid transport system ATP-binding protein